MDKRNIKVGNISNVSGEVIISGRDVIKDYTAEQVANLIAQIRAAFQPKPLDGRCMKKAYSLRYCVICHSIPGLIRLSSNRDPGDRDERSGNP
jgi:hypothetical protein